MTVAGISGRYPTAATALSSGGTGVIDHPHAGQSAAVAAMSAPQCGHSTEAGGEIPGVFAELFTGRFAGLFRGLDNSPSIALPPAVFVSALFANTINLKSVAGGNVMVLVPDLLLDLSNLLREKFDRRAALRTHHVVMIAPVVLMFVTRDPVVEGDFASQSAPREQLKSSIDRRKPDTRISLLD